MDMSPKRKRSNSMAVVEPLEARSLPSITTPTVIANTVADAESNDTADNCQNLGSVTAVEVDGTIDRNGVDVDWYSFTLDVPSTVNLTLSQGTLSLFNDTAGDFSDPLSFGGVRMLDQATGSLLSGVTMQRDLAAGTYFLAASGAGNLYFQPFVADSGLPGVGGSYSLTITSTPLASQPGTSSNLLDVTATPLSVRLSLAAALPYVPTVELLDANGESVGVASIHQNVGTSEVQVLPAAPLAPGQYTVVLKDADGNVQLTEDFSVTAVFGSETGLAGNDTPATAVELGDLGHSQLVQVSGMIGDDPFYQLASPYLPNYAGNDVDLYHFQITSTEAVGLRAEVFAGRIGSLLDAGISLYRLDSTTGSLVLVTGLNQSYNMTDGTTVSVPFYFDPAITAGLTAGDYYLAVSQGSNTTSPLERQTSDTTFGLFDPSIPHSGQAGMNVGNYVLNVQVVSIPDPPQVVSTSVTDQQTLNYSPTELSVSFNEYINLTGLAFAAFQATSESTVAGVFIKGPNGNTYFPRLTAFDADDLEAHLQLLDRLPAGEYELHLSGSQGLTNVVGAPLIGNTPNGDYVVKFSVDTADAGTDGNPRTWTHATETDPATEPQQLGILFPHELQAGVDIVRNRDSKQARDTSDAYQFSVIQEQSYSFSLSGDHLPHNTSLSLFDHAGNVVSTTSGDGNIILTTQLAVGDYVLKVGDWGGAAAKSVSYQVEAFMQGNSDNAPPLWSGPAPAVGIRLAAPAGSPTDGGSAIGGVQSGGGSTGTRGSTSGGTTVGDSGASQGVSSSSSTRTGYLNNLAGLSLINVPDASGNLVIAIPTLGSTGGANVLRANRASNSRLTDRLAATPGGLTDLADGLVGAAGTVERARDRKLTSSRRLGDLIDSAIAGKKDENAEPTNVAEDKKAKPRTDENADQDVVSVEPEQAEGGTAGVTAPADESKDKTHARDLSELQNRRLLEILSLGLEESKSSVVAVVALSNEDGASLKEIDLPRALKYSDKVFAGGLGLLLSALAAQRSSDSELIRSVHRKGKRAEGRWCPSRHAGAREESVS